MSNESRQKFINDIAGYVIKYGPQYGILVNSPIISQAIVESKYGESGLASYHNYFGLKVGSSKSWSGPSVNMKTKEEYSPGTLTTISDNFRVYPTMEEGVKGYFDFINRSRYANLKGVTDPLTYVTNIKNDGYATSSTYVNTIMSYIDKENLTRFDVPQSQQSSSSDIIDVVVQPTVNYSPDVIIDIAKGFLGYSEANGKHKIIIDIYNKQNPLPRGYKVKYTDAWCATFVSACSLQAKYTEIIPTECSCEQMITKFKNIGCWQEDESVTPKKGWVIFYDWQDTGVGDDIGHSDHVGYVMSVSSDGMMQVIEGNYHDEVGIRNIAVNGKNIRGYGIPRYTESGSDSSPITQTTPTQQPVSKPETQSSSSGQVNVSKEIKYKARVTASALNVRSWAGSSYSQVSFSPLKQGTVVGVCDTVKASDGSDWNYIDYNGKHGFCSAKYLEKIEDVSLNQSTGDILVNEPKKDIYEVRVNTKLNMRSTPNSKANNVLYKLPNGTRLEGTGDNPIVSGEQWIGVMYKGTEGYCIAKYLIKL